MVTTRQFSKIWNNSSSLIKLKPKLQHILNFENILEGEIKRLTKKTTSTEHQYHHHKV